jgi:hypothetical protein
MRDDSIERECGNHGADGIVCSLGALTADSMNNSHSSLQSPLTHNKGEENGVYASEYIQEQVLSRREACRFCTSCSASTPGASDWKGHPAHSKHLDQPYAAMDFERLTCELFAHRWRAFDAVPRRRLTK